MKTLLALALLVMPLSARAQERPPPPESTPPISAPDDYNVSPDDEKGSLSSPTKNDTSNVPATPEEVPAAPPSNRPEDESLQGDSSHVGHHGEKEHSTGPNNAVPPPEDKL
jgi:hypothetical protein